MEDAGGAQHGGDRVAATRVEGGRRELAGGGEGGELGGLVRWPRLRIWAQEMDESSPGRETTTLAVNAAKNRARAQKVVGPSFLPKSSRRPGKEPMGVEEVEG
ncbi:uncharacterized protein A4U43_C04F18160 [Asparagus officinalis]|uniref:Uncharacterized protein n=1 Tax=Asparagus officinalis TaxID=4686 RepID=A0A5P1F1V1_ASPOF|nr:uncharacterized protein A4U43_C04F18160 [Asparagus officinalis]